MEKAVKDFINQNISPGCGVMLLFFDGDVYWLKDHHKHLEPEDAFKVKLGTGKPLPNSRESRRIKGGKIFYVEQKLK
jgi:hypothetical protein